MCKLNTASISSLATALLVLSATAAMLLPRAAAAAPADVNSNAAPQSSATMTVESVFGAFEVQLRQNLTHGQGFTFEAKVLFDSEKQILESEIVGKLPQFERIASEQVVNWGDNILEQNFEIEGASQLDRVEGIYKSGQLLAYKITYSAQARQVFENHSQDVLGRISESAYVSLSLRTWFSDPQYSPSFAL
jgi:hypothetical protein